jgi:prepilin-type N-terminal cleavage/methylation domain-containing protein
VKIHLTHNKNPAFQAGFSLLEIILVLLIVGFIVGIASLGINNRSGLDRRVALKEFGNRLNMVLSEAALSGKTWGARIEHATENSDEFIYHWLTLQNGNGKPIWKYAAPYELEERYPFPKDTSVTLLIDNEVIEIPNEIITNEDKNKGSEKNNKKNSEKNTADDDPLKPHIVLQADGEVTPFTLNLVDTGNIDRNDGGLEMKVDSLGRLTLPKAEE